jgi:hypothetical protein
MAVIACRPMLGEKVSAEDSRTGAFAARHFEGRPERGAAVDLFLPGTLDDRRALTFEVLLDLLLRMAPIVTQLRVTADDDRASAIISAAADRIPLEIGGGVDRSLTSVPFGIGPSEVPFVDVNDWCIGFSQAVAPGPTSFIAGPFLGALEASKYIFLCAAKISHAKQIDRFRWPAGQVFDAWGWTWNASGQRNLLTSAQTLPELALVGCGGVGAAYLWFLRKSGLCGRLLLIDHDIIMWHNMNRLEYATVGDANAGRAKVGAAADFMRIGGWEVRALARKAEHPQAMKALEACAQGGGAIASAIGEPEARRFLGRRGFQRFFDAATNTDGSARALALHHGVSTCIECHVRARPQAPRDGGCATANTNDFAGVVPHLAAYAGVMLAIEQVRAILDPSTALAGANTQSIMRGIDAAGRVPTQCCATCPRRG